MIVKIAVNDHFYACNTKITLLDLSKICGFTDFKFCYHSMLPIAGNCRICLVELEDVDKQIASCVTNVESGYVLWTNSLFCKKARENLIENILINHPLDCPICDQGGECDLQDQVKTVGGFKTRFNFNKRMIKDKFTGIIIKTIMTRCIHCLRCVRFKKLIGKQTFGVLNRTNRSEIVYHPFEFSDFEFSGVILDLCPVGALTARQYAFKYRPWELKVIESIDITDSFGSNIYASYKDYELVKISPKYNFFVNGNVITDKIRFSYDAFNTNRLKFIYASDALSKKYEIINWNFFFEQISIIIKKNSIFFLIDEDLDMNSIFFLKKIIYKSCFKIKLFLCNKRNKETFFFKKSTLSLFKLDSCNDFCILFGVNPRYECLLLNLKLRLKYKKLLFSIFCVGKYYNNNIAVQSLNLNVKKTLKFINGSFLKLLNILNISYFPLFIFSESFFKNFYYFNSILFILNQKIKNIQILKLYSKINSSAISLANIISINNTKIKSYFFCLNLNETISLRKIIFDKIIKIFWFTTHRPKKLFFYKYIIPVSTFLEDENYFLTNEHRLQKSQKIITSVKSTYVILKSLFCTLNNIKNTFNFLYLKFFNELFDELNKFISIKNLISNNYLFNKNNSTTIIFKKSRIENEYINNWTKNSLNLRQNILETKMFLTNFPEKL